MMCNCTAEQRGTQICNLDGQSYAACDCSSGSAGSGGSSGGGSAGSAGASNAGAAGAGMSAEPPFQNGIGIPCTSDAQCPQDGSTGLICLLSTSNAEFGDGGPQGGYCSAPCTSTAQCQALDDLSACGLIDMATGSGYCIGLCGPGPGGVKCGADRPQACIQRSSTDATIGACFPVCSSDAGCGPNRFCDLGAGGLGLCVDTAPVGGDVGAPCTESTQAADCKSGICLSFPDAAGGPLASFCSANCTFGNLAGCGFEEESAVPREAGCLQTQFATGAVGDLGFCMELCNADADCTQADWLCENFTPALQGLIGRLGQCIPAALIEGGVDAGPG